MSAGRRWSMSSPSPPRPPSPRRRAECGRRRDERGSGSVLTLAIMMVTTVFAGVAFCVLAWFGNVHQARSAADLAALAGAQSMSAGGDACPAAQRTAAANGAIVTACAVDSNGYQFIVRVTVQVDARPHVSFGPAAFSHTSEAGHVR